MSPILGIWASSKFTQADTGAMFPLQVFTVGAAGASSITFSNIPATYSHLQLRYSVNGTSGSPGRLRMRFNGDTTTSYSYHYLAGNGSNTGAGGGGTFDMISLSVGISQSSTTMAVGVCDILDYANTNKNKTVRTLTGQDLNGSGGIELWSNGWFKTNAITSISFFMDAGNISQYSSIALYGVKGAA